MKRALMGMFMGLLPLVSDGQTPPIPATDVHAGVIQATLKEAMAKKITDIPIRTVDAGGHYVGIGVVQRPKGEKRGGASHDKVTEVYHKLEGAGTLVTGGTMVNPQRRADSAQQVTSINGPGVSSDSIKGGISRRIAKGDVVIIPAGTPHWWSDIEESMTYTVVRVDPARVVGLK